MKHFLVCFQDKHFMIHIFIKSIIFYLPACLLLFLLFLILNICHHFWSSIQLLIITEGEVKLIYFKEII